MRRPDRKRKERVIIASRMRCSCGRRNRRCGRGPLPKTLRPTRLKICTYLTLYYPLFLEDEYCIPCTNDVAPLQECSRYVASEKSQENIQKSFPLFPFRSNKQGSRRCTRKLCGGRQNSFIMLVWIRPRRRDFCWRKPFRENEKTRSNRFNPIRTDVIPRLCNRNESSETPFRELRLIDCRVRK